MDKDFKLILDALKNKTKVDMTPQERLALKVKCLCINYGFHQHEFARLVWGITPDNASDLLNGKKKLQKTYIDYENKLSAWLADNILIKK